MPDEPLDSTCSFCMLAPATRVWGTARVLACAFCADKNTAKEALKEKTAVYLNRRYPDMPKRCFTVLFRLIVVGELPDAEPATLRARSYQWWTEQYGMGPKTLAYINGICREGV
jgi:hypothetical protein